MQRFPSDTEIEVSLKDKDLYNSQAKNRLYYFEQIEHFKNPERVDLSNTSITIEHIFPQNPDIKWKSDLSETEYKLFMDKYLNTVANLTLSGNNGSLGNKIFIEKRDMNKEEGRQGYKYSNLWLNEYLKVIDTWNVDAYEKRFKLLYNKFIEIWKYPTIVISEEDENEYNLYDAPEPKNRKLEYFTFREEMIFTSEFSKMYHFVLTQLFNENPSQFLMSELKDILQITTNKESLRSAYAITENYFLETNNDSNTKFVRLKKF
ncbi:HNH endonuclease family protein [Flavobacterium piscinae]|uniref:HNH endonuclease family protein n=1 Tax=Flavobacterium piscinae TaxID=2506424 RepID=UPI002AAADD62|nr:HNH endonuclease family protein [Flavobacterium piscinae]